MIDSNIDALDTLVLDPVKPSAIENFIRTKNPIPEAAFRLFLKHHRTHKKPQSRILDISGLHFSGEQIIRFVHEHADIQKLGVDTLKLSNNDQINIDALRRILTAFELRRLVLFNIAITNDEIISLVCDEPKFIRHVEGLLHPAFTNVKPKKTLFTPAFTYLSFDSYRTATEVSIPFFTPSSLIHALTAHIRLFNDADAYGPHKNVRAAMAAFATQSPQEGRSWYERTVPFVPSSSGRGRWTLLKVDDTRRGLDLRFNSKENKTVVQTNNYAFIRFNEEPIKEVDPTESAGGCPSFVIYDIRAFLKELELEGRPAADHEELEQLCETYETSAQLLSYDIVGTLTTNPSRRY